MWTWVLDDRERLHIKDISEPPSFALKPSGN